MLSVVVPCGVQLASHNRELAEQLSPMQLDSHGEVQVDHALDYYAKHTGQIEIVRHDRTLEQIVFPIPEICEYLTEETRHRVYMTAERDDQNSKVTDFFSRTDSLFAEMKWQKKLRCESLVVLLCPRDIVSSVFSEIYHCWLFIKLPIITAVICFQFYWETCSRNWFV